MATISKTGLDAYRIRPARGDEIAQLQAIDIASARMFCGLGLIDFGPGGEPVDPIPEDRLRRGLGERLIWVVVDERENVTGFALCADVGDDLYLDQLSVLPEHGRRGLGTRLVRRALEEARTRGFRRVSLSTFRHVPWNGPFYRRLGFREIPGWRLHDWQTEIQERQKTTMDVKLRCFMQKAVLPGWARRL